MSTPFDPDPYGPYERSYNVEMMQSQVYGAFFSAVEFRKSDVGLAGVEVARRMGCTRSQVSKLVSGPQNWTLKTVAELATALDVDFKFVLIDRSNPNRQFDAAGLAYTVSGNRPNWVTLDDPHGSLQSQSTRRIALNHRRPLPQVMASNRPFVGVDARPISVRSQSSPQLVAGET